MASSKIKGINIKIGADTTGLDTALLKIESSGKKASSELRTVNISLKNNSDSVVLWQQKQELLTTAIESSRQKLTLLENAQEQVKQQFENGEIDGGQYRAFQREIENTRDETSRLESQLTEANQRIEELGDGLEHSGQQARDSANGGYTVLGNVFANVITEGIKLAGTALKNFTQDVIATGTEYEAAISNVVAISGAMAEEVELLQSKAEEMGATTKFTATESAEAMSYMAMAGWKVNDMVSGLDGIMDLSAASGESLASVSDIVTDALTAFGLQASDSAHFADVLAAASSNANTNVAMMGETFKYAAPVAGSFGFSVEDTAEAIGLMANSGIKASQAGTSLRRILTEMSHDIQLNGEEIGQFVVETSNADGSMRNLSDILADLRVGWNKLSESEQAANATSVVGTNAMSGFLALMNSAPADVEKLSTAIENADGTAKEMSETMLDNLQGDKTLFESAFDGVKIAISKELNPALRDIVQWGTQQMPKVQAVVEPLFKSAVNGVKSLINGFEKMKPVLSAVKPLIITIFANEAIHLFSKTLLPKALELLGKIPTPLTLISNLITSISDLPTKFITTIGKIPSLVGNIGNAFKGLWAVIAANPIATAVTAATIAGFAIKSCIDNLEIEKTEVELLIEKHNEELQLLADKRQAIKDLNDAFYENVDGIQTQTDRTKDLWIELDKLTDQYGNVQKKDQARAEYILNELNNALGTEYTMTGHQIDNYRTLSAEIDNVIAKKQAEMMLDAYLANSTEMTKQRIEARTDYEKYDKEYQEKLKIFEETEKTFKELTGHDPSEVSFYSDNIEKELQSLLQTGEEYEAGLAMYYARANAQQAKDQRQLAKNRYEATSEYFEKEDQLYEAYSLGQYDKMAEIIYAEKDLTSTTLDETATDAEERLKIFNDSCEKILTLFQLNSKKISQSSVDEISKELETVMKNAALTENDPAEVWEKNFKKYFDEYLEKGFDVSPMIAFADDLNMSPADLLGNEYREVIRKQRENGHSIEDFLNLAINSDYKPEITFGGADNFNDYLWERLTAGQDIEHLIDWGFSDGDKNIIDSNEFQDAYRETIQQHLENGLDVDGLLKWNDKANLAGSEEFVDVFKKTVENKLENDEYVGSLLEWGNTLGIDMGDIFGERFAEQMETLHANDADLTDFIKWAEANGNTVGTIFGENFQEALEEFLALPTEEVKIPNIFEDDTLAKNLINYYKKGQDLSNLSKQARKQGRQIGSIFGDNYMDVIQQQLNDGCDIQELVKWAIETGGTISEEYSDVYANIVQEYLDKGYDIEKLLKWGKDSGLSTADTFGGTYSPEAQTFIDKGFAIDSLLTWAKNAGFEVGKLFGENFQEYVNRYIHDKRNEAESVLAHAGPISSSILEKLPFMADGGFLSHGHAIVAEAGPELLEVVNGGVRVTPLTQNSRNNPVNSDGGQRIFYSNYTINATIASSYDVSRLAEDLETERRRIEMGMGKT
ncbi:MAG: phage tail tape measure protein [Prevotella sp.]|nr:phage tail tape measure protein [Alistipes senegalensis]MCM1357106.1 phage tail tape measure protein [Prevotella sp.]MCM1472572.1 phage tail tape measure protein [Muribaculaceae bacterium]